MQMLGRPANDASQRLRVQFFLTRPSHRQQYDAIWRRFGGFHSLAVPVLLALTPPDVDVEVVEQGDREALVRYADIAAVSFMTSHAKAAYQLCDDLRRIGKTVVVGGIHASALPDEALEHADVVCIGAGENTWPAILSDFARGHLKRTYRDTSPGSIADLPRARHDLMPRHLFREHVFMTDSKAKGDCYTRTGPNTTAHMLSSNHWV